MRPRLIVALATSLLCNCGDDSPEPCPDEVAWVNEVSVDAGEEVGCMPLLLNRNVDGEVRCQVVELLTAGGLCAEIEGRTTDGVDQETGRTRCVVNQVPAMGAGAAGWYFDDFSADVLERCPDNPRSISFTEGAEPGAGSLVRTECVYSLQAQSETVGVGISCAADPAICGFPPAALLIDFPLGLACDSADSVTCQPLCNSAADCPPDYVCFDANRDGTSFCVDPLCTPVE